MKVSVPVSVSLLLAAILPSTIVATRDKTVMVKRDSMTFTDTGIAVNITGEGCHGSGTQPAEGTGTYPTFTIQYNCLNTGFYDNEDFAVACGFLNGNTSAKVCQAWRTNDTLTNADGLVSAIITCDEVAAGKCGTNLTGCSVNCTDTEVCAEIGGINFFEGNNLNNKTNYFTAPSTGTVTINPKRLIVGGHGGAVSTKWRQMTTGDLCFFGSTVNKCMATKTGMYKKQFTACVNDHFDKYTKWQWITKLDRVVTLRAITKAVLPFIKPTKAPKKKGGKGKGSRN